MSITLHPSDGIVISKKWLEGEIARLSNLKPDEVRLPQKVYTQLHLLTHILQFRSQPLKPVLEMALNHGILCGIAVSFFDDMRQTKEVERVKQEFLNNPIELTSRQDDKTPQ